MATAAAPGSDDDVNAIARLPRVGLLLLGVLLAVHAAQYWIAIDDAFISFRFAENLAAGHGLVFNMGERVEGYTDFLWVVLLAAARLLGAATPLAGKLLGVAASIATLPVIYLAARRLRLGVWLALAPCVPLATSAAVAMWSGGGLETTTYMALFSVALLLADRDLEVRRDRQVRGDRQARCDLQVRCDRAHRPWSGVVFALAALTRPEAAGLFVVVLLLGVLRKAPWRRLGSMALGFSALFVPHLVFRLLYYGYPLPNTFYAKTQVGMEAVVAGLGYARQFADAHALWWVLPALLGLLVVIRGDAERAEHDAERDEKPPPDAESPRWPAAFPALVLLSATGYIIVVGGDFMILHRFFVPYWPWLGLLTCVGAQRLGVFVARRLDGRFRAWLPAALIVAVTLGLSIPAWSRAGARAARAWDGVKRNGLLHGQLGRWLAKHRPGKVVAGSAMGRVPYYSGLRTIDMLGLIDTHIAHSPARSEGAIAHRRYDSAYILRRKPDLVAVEFWMQQRGRFDPREDVHTEKIQHLLVRRWNAWPALTDLVSRRDFRLRYAPRVAEISPGRFCFFFERDDTLVRMRARVSSRSTDPQALFRLVARDRLQGLTDHAIATLRRAIELDPKSLVLKLNVGNLFYDARRFPEALEAFRRLVRAYPDEAPPRYGLALTLQKMHRYREAISEWRRFFGLGGSGARAATARAKLEQALRVVAGGVL